MNRRFAQVDVFTETPCMGNGLAVVIDGEGLSDDAMLAFTRWTQLSEATFVLPPTDPRADYRVRIFYGGGELPFAGHPTLGTCHAWLKAGGKPKSVDGLRVMQECGAGLIEVRREPMHGTGQERLSFAAPPRRRSGPLPSDELQRIMKALRVDANEVVAHAWCDNGPAWRGLLLRSAHAVLALKPDMSALTGLEVGVVGPYAASQANQDSTVPQFEVRAFFPQGESAGEGPLTGSLYDHSLTLH